MYLHIIFRIVLSTATSVHTPPSSPTLREAVTLYRAGFYEQNCSKIVPKGYNVLLGNFAYLQPAILNVSDIVATDQTITSW